VDALATAVIWISVGSALVLLIYEQSRRLADFTKAQANSRAAVAQEIVDLCGDRAPVAIYEELAARVPDSLVYYALAETRQKLTAGELAEGPGAYFTRTITRLAEQSHGGVPVQAVA
jgi:Tfp pilus assembly protein PilN